MSPKIIAIRSLLYARRCQQAWPIAGEQLGRLHKLYDDKFDTRDERINALRWLTGRPISSFRDLTHGEAVALISAAGWPDFQAVLEEARVYYARLVRISRGTIPVAGETRNDPRPQTPVWDVWEELSV